MQTYTIFVSFIFTISVFLVGDTEDHEYRPLFHYTPEKNWMNDPNGMFYDKGTYHLFYQYNPYGNNWGNMHWGHATSKDLISWEHQPIALEQEDNIMMYSGSAVVDRENTSGLGTEDNYPIVAIYTAHHTDKPLQTQSIAYSLDGGYNWTKYEDNPVLNINSPNFRDPKVFWHQETRKWIMVVALSEKRKVQIYGSDNLLDWEFLSDFGPLGSTSGIWECPDLFPLPVDGDSSNMKWVMEVDMNANTNNPGSGGQYFIGEFDGVTFTPDPVHPESIPEGKIFEGFETGYSKWSITGDAFGDSPASGTLPNQQEVTGFKGDGLVNTFSNGDLSTGTAISSEFTINKDYINLLVGGGAHKNTSVQLIINDEIVKYATGSNSEKLRWKAWEVSQYQGEEGRIKIVDENTGGWGHILVDHILLADKPAISKSREFEWVDFGHDFYAAVSWFNDSPNAKKQWVAWANNWAYAGAIPTGEWRGTMTLPRNLSLSSTPKGPKLVQEPVEAYKSLRGIEYKDNQIIVSDRWDFPNNDLLRTGAFEINVILENSSASKYGLRLKDFSKGELVIAVDKKRGNLIVTREESSPEFSSNIFNQPQIIEWSNTTKLDIKIIYDKSIFEVFINGGLYTFTNRIFLNNEDLTAQVFSEGGETEISSIQAFSLNPKLDTDAEQDVKPAKFQLHQNYPNPFNPSTKIPFTLQNSGVVSLSVYDVLGREVARLIEGRRFTAGSHYQAWDGTGESGQKVSSGTYLIRLEAGNQVQTQTMTIIK